MLACGSWRAALCVLGLAVAVLCMNEIQYEDYPYNYDNEISEDQQQQEEGDSPSTLCPAVDFSRWDKLFIALEDSHMRQNMLLESVEQCRAGTSSVRSKVEKLAKGASCQRCVAAVEAACRAKGEEQASFELRRGLLELARGEVERERRLNATLHALLHSSHEENARLKRLEKGVGYQGHQPTPRPTPRPAAPPFGLGTRPTPPPSSSDVMDMATMEKALVAIATELQRVHLQLSRVIERAGKS